MKTNDFLKRGECHRLIIGDYAIVPLWQATCWLARAAAAAARGVAGAAVRLASAIRAFTMDFVYVFSNSELERILF